MNVTDQRACRTCRHFEQRARIIESEFAGLATLSSAYGSVRSQDGLCELWARYAAESSMCHLHSPRSSGGSPEVTESAARSLHPDRIPIEPL